MTHMSESYSVGLYQGEIDIKMLMPYLKFIL